MRHLTAAQRADGSGWHYCSLSKRGGYALGYCAEHAPHASEDDARRCYRTWQRDHIRLDQRFTNWGDCAIAGCGEPTKLGARIEGDGYSMARLCQKHTTATDARTALMLDGDLADESWES